MSGFINGQMLLQSSMVSLEEGWKLPLGHFPSGSPTQPLQPQGIRSWQEYVEFRQLPAESIAPLLLTNVLTVYHMIYHELGLGREEQLSVFLMGPEVELNQIPIFGELVYLLPDTDLKLKLVGPAVKGLCDEAKQNHRNSLIVRRKELLFFNPPKAYFNASGWYVAAATTINLSDLSLLEANCNANPSC